MDHFTMNRRSLIAGGLGVAASLAMPAPLIAATRPKSRLKLGIIGTGQRGQVLLREVLRRADIDLAAICDIDQFVIDRTLEQVKAAGGRKAPQVYTGSNEAWQDMLGKSGLDGVIIATPWKWHAPMAIGAMKAKIPVGCEVVAGISLQDH